MGTTLSEMAINWGEYKITDIAKASTDDLMNAITLLSDSYRHHPQRHLKKVLEEMLDEVGERRIWL